MKQIRMALLASTIMVFIGCGGGSESTIIYADNVSEVIENKPFYRVKTADERYLKEVFEGNGTLSEEIYFMNDDFDTNRTIPYLIDSNQVYITDNNISIRCRIEDSNLSVIFWCIKVGASGSLLPTYRWRTLEDAKLNPEP